MLWKKFNININMFTTLYHNNKQQITKRIKNTPSPRKSNETNTTKCKENMTWSGKLYSFLFL